jgi:mannitol-specific phosphotransferase system IIBC component
MSGGLVGVLTTMAVMSIPVTAIILSYRQKTQKNKIREMELQKEILSLEMQKQDKAIKLLEEENNKLDRIIYK